MPVRMTSSPRSFTRCRPSARRNPQTRLRDVDGEPIRPAQVRLLERRAKELVLEIVIHEGKNRQIRRMCRQCGLEVVRLLRVAEHSLTLGGLCPGQWRYLTEEEVLTSPRARSGSHGTFWRTTTRLPL